MRIVLDLDMFSQKHPLSAYSEDDKSTESEDVRALHPKSAASSDSVRVTKSKQKKEKVKWALVEEECLVDGLLKYPAGQPKRYVTIVTDPEFKKVLHGRSNNDCKEKARNKEFTSKYGHRLKPPVGNPVPVTSVPAGPSHTAAPPPAAAGPLVEAAPGAIGDVLPLLSEARPSVRQAVLQAVRDLNGTRPDHGKIFNHLKQQYTCEEVDRRALSNSLKSLTKSKSIVNNGDHTYSLP